MPMRLWFILDSGCHSVPRLIWQKRMGDQHRPLSNVGPWKAQTGRAGTSAGRVILNIASPIRKSGKPVVPVRQQGDHDQYSEDRGGDRPEKAGDVKNGTPPTVRGRNV
jgi:hypothetical protein